MPRWQRRTPTCSSSVSAFALTAAELSSRRLCLLGCRCACEERSVREVQTAPRFLVLQDEGRRVVRVSESLPGGVAVAGTATVWADASFCPFPAGNVRPPCEDECRCGRRGCCFIGRCPPVI